MLSSETSQVPLDFEYLEKRAVCEDVLDVLNLFKAEVEISRLAGGEMKKP